MESSDDAGVNLFTIGPSTVLGRALAFRILFCRSSRKIVQAICAKTSCYLQRAKWAARVLAASVSPRRPAALLILLAIGFLYRRSRSQGLRADQAFRRKFWQNVMKSAVSYEEWAHAATMTEREQCRRKDSDLYDEELVRAKLQELQRCRLEGGIEDTLFCLRADLVRNLGNMCNPELHQGRLQAPALIQAYINEVRFQLRAVCDGDGEEVVSLGERIAFMRETRHGFGRTALLLSGGAALGSFHVGVVRALIQQRLLPRVLAGASVGSILCSFAATRTWPELHSFFDDPMPPMLFFDALGSVFATASRLLTHGAVHEIGVLQRQMRQLIGDLTFQEAYDLSGRVLGISVCSSRRHEPPRLLNYLTSPHVVIWSAVTASCAFPGLFEAQELMAKNRQGQLMPYHALSQVAPLLGGVMRPRAWRDGSLESDLPMLQLKELFNVNHFIVSQANPHIAPLLRMKEFFRAFGGHFAGKLAHLVEMEVKHRCNQVLEMGFRAYGLAKLFAQDWEGDVTIVMPATLAQLTRLIQNPTPSDIRKAAMQGRRCTWEKLSAIQANCGIELMLDECVFELNHKLNAKKKAHSSTLLGRLTSIKRIPSWNCLARENSSCSSLEDDITDVVLQAGGPWGGPSLRKLRPVHNHDGSDSESSVETLDHNTTGWTKAGGPLMRTSSSKKFILLYDSTINNTCGQLVKENLHSKDSANDADQLKTQNPKHEITNNWEVCTSIDMNKINDNLVTANLTHTRLPHNKHKDDDTQFEDFSFPWETTLSKQSSSINESPAFLLIEGEQHVPYIGASLSGFKDQKENEQNI